MNKTEFLLKLSVSFHDNSVIPSCTVYLQIFLDNAVTMLSKRSWKSQKPELFSFGTAKSIIKYLSPLIGFMIKSPSLKGVVTARLSLSNEKNSMT